MAGQDFDTGNKDFEAFAKTLRDAAMVETNPDLHYTLRGVADLLDNAIEEFAENRNAYSLRDLQGIWAHAVRVLKAHREPRQPQPPVSQNAGQEVGQAQRKAA